MDEKKLVTMALQARENAYAPYSHFKVGAALLARDGQIFTGCNVENAAFGAGICAERTALFKAVSEGVREFEAIAVVGADESAQGELPVAAPCGICRQALYEFGGDELTVIMGQSEEKWKAMRLKELLPVGFGPMALGK